FKDGGNAISGCGAQTLSSGTATCTTSSLSTGSNSITAVYGGDTNNQASTSSAITQTVHDVPGAPSGVSASAGDGQATVSWSAAADNGSAVTSYTVTAAPGGRTCTTSGALHCTVPGLTNGTAYRFTVKATNGIGSGPASAASSEVTPHQPTPPSGLTAGYSHNALVLNWKAPTDLLVDHYELFLNGQPIRSVPRTQTSINVHGFERRGPSIFTLRAVDAAGDESSIVASFRVVPARRPAAAARRIPQWAWRILAWQKHGKTGTRPQGAPLPLPHWYSVWKQWRLHLFKLAS
ncbi:MAG: fibronectin type III domain-containing protein, partial [Gaiellaceae bacterium]